MHLCFTLSMKQPLLPLRFLALFLMTLTLAACAAKVDRGPVSDILTLPQDLTAYLDPATANQPIFEDLQQQSMSQEYLVKFFSPWDRTETSYTKEDLFWGFDRYASRTTWGENYRSRDPQWVQKLALLADPGDYPNTSRPAITTAHASMRVLPTMEPIFSDPTQPGEGFPFDYNQNSLVWAGTPLFVVQTSADGAWLLCETRFAGGWIPARDIAFVDETFMTQYRSGPFAAVIGENLPMTTIKDGLFRMQARLGMLLPLRERNEDRSMEVLLPLRGLDGNAQQGQALLPSGASAHFPLMATQTNIAALGNRMMGQPYGWGGLFERRDCSATLMDLFAPFGIALPRNSRGQAKVGDVVDVSGLTPLEKKAKLASMPPLSTLVGKRGHIMLYAGQYQGEPLIYHTAWGVRTTNKGPLPGRRIIGKTVITTMEPGKEVRNLGKKALLIETITSFSDLKTTTTK